MSLVTGYRSSHMYVAIFLVALRAVPCQRSDGIEKVSDACHGPSAFRQTRNILTCNNETQICITDVRYYQWNPLDQNCPYLISQPVAVRCCCRIPSRCSVVTDDRQELQRNCTGQTSCSLHSAMSEKVSPPCNSSQSGSEVSSVRSITYICSSAGTCPPPATTTNRAGLSEETSSTKTSVMGIPTTRPSPPTETIYQSTVTSNNRTSNNNTFEPKDTGAIVGGVIGGLVICALIVVLLALLWKRRSAQKSPGAVDDVRDTQMASRPGAAYDYITSGYSMNQPERGDNNLSWNRAAETNVSDLYSEVNKTKNHHGEYDRVQGEAAHFKVHGDYHHVTRQSFTENSFNDVTGRVAGNADVDMTYNQLHRGGAATARTESDADPYDVLNRANARAT